ncbi:MAG: N-acetylmuramoyl-L-alanine amidase [Lachnospiraceae bacterium]|nr:N-acetylmuramoyl-L-alanine amidase [Lachnospiraceae bacterium]
MAYTVYLDAGHGGYDAGATGYGRKEKDDNLKLTLAVGEILQGLGVNVGYTRVEDVYDSPLRKAQIANEAGADLFVSIHRNASTYNNRYEGVQTLIFDESGIKKEMADAINEALEEVGFKNVGTEVRRDLAVLRRTEMPSLLVEVGFIDTEKDNAIFDESFDEMAGAIAYAIYNTLVANGLIMGNEGMIPRTIPSAAEGAAVQQMIPEYNRQEESAVWERSMTVPVPEPNVTNPRMNTGVVTEEMTEDAAEEKENVMEDAAEGARRSPCFWRCMMQCGGEPEEQEPFYQVQTGLFRVYQNAANMKRQLERQGYPAIIQLYKDFYAVRTGYYDTAARARQSEEKLKKLGYDTLIVTVK